MMIALSRAKEKAAFIHSQLSLPMDTTEQTGDKWFQLNGITRFGEQNYINAKAALTFFPAALG